MVRINSDLFLGQQKQNLSLVCDAEWEIPVGRHIERVEHKVLPSFRYTPVLPRAGVSLFALMTDDLITDFFVPVLSNV